METLIPIMMVLVCCCFVLKLSFHRMRTTVALTTIIATLVALSWPLAIEQSRTQLAGWLADPELMLDMAVLLSVDVASLLLYCLYEVDRETAAYMSKSKCAFYHFLKYLPGVLIVPVLFSLLVWMIFQLPGYSFEGLAWGLAGALLLLIPLLTYGVKVLIAEPEIRLELLFLLAVLLGLMGLISTVNGRTAVTGVNQLDSAALVGDLLLVCTGGIIGWCVQRIRMNRQLKSI